MNIKRSTLHATVNFCSSHLTFDLTNRQNYSDVRENRDLSSDIFYCCKNLSERLCKIRNFSYLLKNFLNSCEKFSSNRY